MKPSRKQHPSPAEVKKLVGASSFVGTIYSRSLASIGAVFWLAQYKDQRTDHYRFQKQ
jgi:hypothetical protein